MHAVYFCGRVVYLGDRAYRRCRPHFEALKITDATDDQIERQLKSDYESFKYAREANDGDMKRLSQMLTGD